MLTFFSTFVQFQDFSGREKSKLKFQDFSGPVETLFSRLHSCIGISKPWQMYSTFKPYHCCCGINILTQSKACVASDYLLVQVLNMWYFVGATLPARMKMVWPFIHQLNVWCIFSFELVRSVTLTFDLKWSHKFQLLHTTCVPNLNLIMSILSVVVSPNAIHRHAEISWPCDLDLWPSAFDCLLNHTSNN